MIDRDTVDRIYAVADIVDVVSEFVTLKKKGTNYQACCPFHSERTPSFVVSPAKGLFKCFGCGKAGNAVTFVMEHEKMTYGDALKYVAKKYGIEVQERELSPEEAKRNDDRESMMVVSGWASDYFTGILRDTDEGLSVGMGYFRERGFTDATIRKFVLGYCPSKGDAMTTAALKAGYKEQFLIDTGLTIKRETGGYYDRFTGRVIFPIHSISGRVIAFGGRILKKSDHTAKYVNSPESIIYSKSHSLYGLYQAKNAIVKENHCILVEGYTDVMRMHQTGIENVVASSGTSLTVDQIKLIARFTKNITVIYDGDPAGIKASLRGIDMILREGLNVRVVLLPAPEDPDSFARTRSSEEVKAFIEQHEEDFIRFKTRLLMADAGADPLKKASLITEIVQSISEIPDPIIRSVFIKDCARTMDVDEQVLIGEVSRKRHSVNYDRQTGEFMRNMQAQKVQEEKAMVRLTSFKDVAAGSNIEELEKEIVGYLMKYGHMYFEHKEGKNMVRFNVAETIFSDLRDDVSIRNPQFRAIYECYEQHYAEFGEGVKVPEHLFTNHEDPQVCNVAVDILTSDTNYVMSDLWKRHEIFLESEEQRLADLIPRAVTLYKSKTIESIINELKHRLADENISEEELVTIMGNISALNEVRTKISKKISRLIL